MSIHLLGVYPKESPIELVSIHLIDIRERHKRRVLLSTLKFYLWILCLFGLPFALETKRRIEVADETILGTMACAWEISSGVYT